MILTKSPSSLHDPAEPTPWTLPVLHFFRCSGPLFPRTPLFPALRSGLGGRSVAKPRHRVFHRPTPQKQIPGMHACVSVGDFFNAYSEMERWDICRKHG